MIRLEKVDKYYNKGQANAIHVLNQITLELPDTGMVAVFGRSGCGKTTLLNAIGGLDGFSGGSLTVNGQDIRKDTDTLRNREIGYIFQNYNLIPTVGMAKFSLRRPDTLSGGQQQRAAIARAIVKDPPVILADEPTGNLDEANTLQVMDMLRSLAKDRLVVLVTHEAHLVDLYCDVVVKLSDGKVESVYTNDNAAGLDAAKRSEIWLGELPRSETVWRAADVEYYGEAPEEPVHIVVVNHEGRLYLKVKSPGVRVLDENSEIKLKEGRYEPRPEGERQAMDLSTLPKLTPGKCGRLFRLKDSVRSGLDMVSRRGKKKGSRLLRFVMMLFAAILVLTSASSGTSFRKIKEAGGTVSGQLYYLKADSTAALEAIRKAAVPENGFDSVYYRIFYGETPYVLPEFRITPGHFLTSSAMGSRLTLQAAPLPAGKLPAGTAVLAGALGADGAVLTRAAADALLETSSVGYIKTYRDLIGLSLASGREGEENTQPGISAVVEGSEKIIYLPGPALADWLLSDGSLNIYRDSLVKGYENVPEGRAVVVRYYENAADSLKPGDTLTARGAELTVDRVIDAFTEDQDDSAFYREIREGEYSYREPLTWGNVCVLVSDADCEKIAASLGKTDTLFTYDTDLYDLDKNENRYRSWYAVCHASDAGKAEAAVRALEENAGVGGATPAEAREEALREAKAGSRGSMVTLGVMTAILCLCMYFIMRANLMGRVREVGIRRAIGVTKKNLVFRFLIEALVLCASTVLIGFLLSSFVMRLWVTNSALMKMLFYYPLWMMLVLLVLLVSLCAFCGVLPVLLLLRKKPSAILAKYDI